MIRALARQEQELHRVLDDAKAAVDGLEDAHQHIREGDMTGVGDLYDSAKDAFNQAAVAFEVWIKNAPDDRRMMLYRAVVIRILASTHMLIDAIPYLTNPHDAHAHRSDEIVDAVRGQLVRDFALLRNMPAAIRSSEVYLKVEEGDRRLATEWADKIAPLRADIAGFATEP